MPFSTALAERALGKYPLSIATSLALESAANNHDDLKYDFIPLQKYDALYVNVRTLFRNLMGSLSHENQDAAVPELLAEAIWFEMEQIKSIVAEQNSQMKVVFYYSDYFGMEIKYRHALIRRDNTPKQKEYTSLQNVTMEHFLKAHKDDVLLVKLKVAPREDEKVKKTLILTHYPYDLVNHKAFGNLDLLESHTGKIKPLSQWYTKYYNGKDLPPGMPFREDLIQVFGDKEHFVPMARELRTDLIDLAKKYNWTSVSTTDKIRYGVNEIRNPMAKEILLSILVH